ncbi:hypothetical protein PIB30_081869 [Stylosanthes scabra]|uniref:Uncharacterized protein n=1 Tax=Stylosanthes scabra TaxID=79078 RepID=A0ABU6YPF4_9FABA|nr:hypothetical protein [Stylosanthes scabra]
MSSSSDMHDAHCFRSQFHQDLFEEHVASKSVTPETSFDLQEDETKEEIASGEAYPYNSYVRGVTIDFSAANIREILRIRDNTPRVETDFNTCQREDQRLDEGEDVRVEELIADNIAIVAEGVQVRGKLIFPSTIYRLCKEVGVFFREFKGTEYIPIDKPITARVMVRTRGRNVNYIQDQHMEEEQDHVQQNENEA